MEKFINSFLIPASWIVLVIVFLGLGVSGLVNLERNSYQSNIQKQLDHPLGKNSLVYQDTFIKCVALLPKQASSTVEDNDTSDMMAECRYAADKASECKKSLDKNCI